MQRYYFEIKIDGVIIADDRGKDFDDLAGAHAHAAKVVDDCIRFCPPEPAASRGHIDVIDETGQRFLTVLFPAPDRPPRQANQRTARRTRRRVESSTGV